MRITFVSPPPHIGGGQRVIATYAARLHHRGHHVTVVAPPRPKISARHIVHSMIRGHGLPRRDRAHHYTDPGIDLRITDRPNRVKSEDVPDGDVVIATFWTTAEWVASFPQSKGSKVILIQGYESFPHLPNKRLDDSWRMPMAKLVVSQWLADLARDRFGDPTAKVVPNAVDHSIFHALPRGKQVLPTVGIMCASGPFKGLDVAAAAIRKAASRLPGLQVRAFGTERLPKGLLPSNTVYFRSPPQDRIRDIYAGCDAWLFASRNEGFGLPILEAMACRTPVIGTPAGAAPELLAGGGGYLVRMDDPDDMADALHRLCTLPESDWKAMSEAAYTTATRYSWDDATDRFEAALQAAVRSEVSK